MSDVKIGTFYISKLDETRAEILNVYKWRRGTIVVYRTLYYFGVVLTKGKYRFLEHYKLENKGKE